MRIVFCAVGAIVVAVLGAGCRGKGGASTPATTPGLAVTRITAFDPDRKLILSVVSHALPDGREVPLTAVAPLIPAHLPRNPSQHSCRRGIAQPVTVTLANGRSVNYGPYCLPLKITWLQSAITAEAGEWSAPVVARTRIVGACPAETSELRRILAGLGPTRVRQVWLESSSGTHTCTPRTDTVSMAVNAGASLRGEWEAAAVMRLYNASSRRLHFRRIDQWKEDDGSGPADYFGIGGPARDLDSVRRLVAGTGAQIVELRLEAGALAVTLRAQDPGAFLEHSGATLFAKLRESEPNSSVYFGLEDGYGSVVDANGWLPKEGMWSARPDLGSCGSNRQGDYVGRPVPLPPCPA